MGRAQRVAFDSRRRTAVPGGRSISYRIALSVDEAERLERFAAQEGVTVARLVVELALKGLVPSERRAVVGAVLDMRRHVQGVGVNVNQLARWANSTGAFPVEAATVTRRVGAMLDRLERFAAEVGA